jgi:hypothetical protein
MTYAEAQVATITRKEALAELTLHGFEADSVDVLEFFNALGDKPTYSGRDVLNWLGY